MKQSLSAVTLLVPDYDDAIAFYVGMLGFILVEDSPLTPDKRWVRVAPTNESAAQGCCLLLAKAATRDQARAIGNQTGGRVFLFLQTDDFDRDYARYRAAGVAFAERPRDEPYGRVAVFQDPFGNRWDLIEPAKGMPASRFDQNNKTLE
ncbi:MAG: VOC family protein [Alphaproteobacteria bacterium]